MFKRSCNTSAAMENCLNMITTYKVHCSKFYRTEEAKIENLQNALAEVEWTKPALTQRYQHHDPPWTFYLLYTALDTSWLQEQHFRKDDPATENIIDILFEWQ